MCTRKNSACDVKWAQKSGDLTWKNFTHMGDKTKILSEVDSFFVHRSNITNEDQCTGSGGQMKDKIFILKTEHYVGKRLSLFVKMYFIRFTNSTKSKTRRTQDKKRSL